ncbi:MAG TPA: DUF1552 domain-containing protein [Polyangiaceae bacterium]|nr:DUF1552 domain-containing protein [Polyangiaceae bacterium]
MNNRHFTAPAINRRTVLRGAGGLMLGLPLLEGFTTGKAAAQSATRSPFVLFVVSDNGVVQAGVTLGGAPEAERFWPTATGTLTKASMLADKATRSTGELSDYADKLLIVRGVNLPYGSNGCSHSAADAQILTAASITPGSTNCLATGVSVDTAIAKAKNPPGRDPLVLHAGMFSPGGTGFDIPGYVSYVAAKQPRVYIDSPYKAYQAITGVVGTGAMGSSADAQAQQLRAARSKSINDLLRPQIKELLARPELSQSDIDRLNQHFTAIRDIEVKMTTTSFMVPDADVTAMKQMDSKPYDQQNREAAIRLHLELMAFAVAADYTRVAVLKIGDRIDDHQYTINGQTFKFHDASHRAVANGEDLHHAVDRLIFGHYKYLLDTLSSYSTPSGSLLDQGVSIWANQCATGAHSFSNVPWILAGSANGFFKQGKFVTVGTGQMPGGRQDGVGGDPSVSGVNKMLNTVLTAAGVTGANGAAKDDFGDPSLPKGIFSELLA